MKFGIVIPAHNEADHIDQCLNSFITQTLKPDKLVIVDDNSTDDTSRILSEFDSQYSWIEVVSFKSSEQHLPGAKVVRAFNHGLAQMDDSIEFIGKFDADIILPVNYFEEVFNEFERNGQLGICSGLLYIEEDHNWVYERIAAKTHVRGPVKLYRKTCFDDIGGLRPGVGWDTADVLLAQYNGYVIKTLPNLMVKHLRPTGTSYDKKKSLLQGKSYFRLRYGIALTFLAALKMSWNKRSLPVIWNSLAGYFRARTEKREPLVSEEEGRYIRQLRWKKIKQSLF